MPYFHIIGLAIKTQTKQKINFQICTPLQKNIIPVMKNKIKAVPRFGWFKIKKNGLLNGALIGGIYLIGIYLLSGIINHNFSVTIQSLIIIVAGMICGMFGGIIGVNKANGWNISFIFTFWKKNI